MMIFVSIFTFAAVEEFSSYNTEIKINANNTMDVYKQITLRNIHIVGIVPGRIEFKIGKGTDGSVSNFELTNIRAYDRHGKEIKTKVLETKDNLVIAMDIFTPILPGFEYKIDLYYTLNFDSSGIFFKNMEIPVKEKTSINIREGSFKLELPENYYFTYISDEYNNTLVEDNVAKWTIDGTSPGSVRIEYSYIPLKFSGVKGSYIFWVIINIVLLIILSFEIKKEVRRHKKR